MGSDQRAVVVVGGGPTGVMLAIELKLAGVDALILERRAPDETMGSRSGGLQARTIELLDQRGVGERFVSQGEPVQVQRFAAALDISDFPSRRPYGLALWQNRFEQILGQWASELGVEIAHSCAVADFEQDADGVDVALADGRRLRTLYLVGCDGGRSTVRKTAGIEFAGWDPSISTLIAEVQFRDQPELGVRIDEKGISGIGPLDQTHLRVVVRERELVRGGEITEADLRAAMIAVWGSDFGVHNIKWLSRFTDATRQAARYHAGRVLLAGDSAHIHTPMGGQGLNTGLQDAVNLGWKLAQVVDGTSPADLLDTYNSERHPVGARAQRNTMAMTALARTDPRTVALNDTVAELMQLDQPRKQMAGELSGLGIHYDLGEGHPLLGRRVPDLDLMVGEQPSHVYALLHVARPVLLELDGQSCLDLGQWTDRVSHVTATCVGPWELPVVGPVCAPTAVLIRPDGHVAWVGEGDDAGLVEALGTWFGPV